jgi:hypothetical protein
MVNTKVSLWMCLNNHHAGQDAFLTLALDGVEYSASRSGRFMPDVPIG